MLLDSLKSIEDDGFSGFQTVKDLMRDCSHIPKVKGIYLVIYLGENIPHFVETGTGGHFKGKNPNVSISILESNWVKDTPVIYIGKAGGSGSSATLRSRINQYMKFGQGMNIGHWGGRYIWQIANATELVLGWKTLPDQEPRAVESQLIQDFIEKYGNRPFANLTG